MGFNKKVIGNNTPKRVNQIQTEMEDLGPPSDPAMGGMDEPPKADFSYGLGFDLTHGGISAENPIVWPQNDGNSGRNS